MNKIFIAAFVAFAPVAFVISSILLIASCNANPEIATGQSTKVEMEQTESNHNRLATAQPPPHLELSLERKNLIERLKRLNTDNRIGYVYCLSQAGQVMAFYTIKGKVSSLNSYLTTPEQIVDHRLPYNTSTLAYTAHTMPSPDFDGSYGKNPEGIFFFTTEDALVEWSGDYLYSDQPLKLTTQPVLIMPLDAKGAGLTQPVPVAPVSHK